jgi:hypothetical protein
VYKEFGLSSTAEKKRLKVVQDKVTGKYLDLREMKKQKGGET